MCDIIIMKDYVLEESAEMKRIRSTLILILTAVIWGLAFVAQREGAKYVGPFTFNAVRFALGALVLVPVFLIAERKASKEARRAALKYGVVAGVLLFAAAITQQIGINMTQSAGKSAFITGLYTILVPIAYFVFFRRRTGVNVVIGALIAVVGLYLLCGSMGALGPGDLFLFVCAVFWSAQIMWVDRAVSGDVPPITFSAVEFAAASAICAACAFFTENVNADSLRPAALPLLYAGIMSTGVAFTCQAIGQKNADPTAASIVMSTEAVWAAIGGALILGERMTAAGIAGCALMLTGIIAAQIDLKKLKR